MRVWLWTDQWFLPSRMGKPRGGGEQETDRQRSGVPGSSAMLSLWLVRFRPPSLSLLLTNISCLAMSSRGPSSPPRPSRRNHRSHWHFQPFQEGGVPGRWLRRKVSPSAPSPSYVFACLFPREEGRARGAMMTPSSSPVISAPWQRRMRRGATASTRSG